VSDRDLFIAALQIEDPTGRTAYLDQACGGDTALRQRVEDLLLAFVQMGSFLQPPPAAGATIRPLGRAVGGGGGLSDAERCRRLDPRPTRP
jgi:hypothetical protein